MPGIYAHESQMGGNFEEVMVSGHDEISEVLFVYNTCVNQTYMTLSCDIHIYSVREWVGDIIVGWCERERLTAQIYAMPATPFTNMVKPRFEHTY